MSAREEVTWAASGRCETGKISFPTRAAGKLEAARLRALGRGPMRPYVCECGGWHIGHKPAAVIRGEVSADEFYGRA